MKESLKRRKIVYWVTACIVVALSSFVACKRASTTAPSSAMVPVDPWKEAVEKVEQDRGEAVGRNATVEIPQELKHYADRRRFLAIQAADSRAHVDKISVDFADLATMIHRGELVEMKPLGADYILYGVGENANSEPFAHYDSATRQEITLPATEEEFKGEVKRASDAAKQDAARLAQAEIAWRRAPRRNRARRAALMADVSKARKASAATRAESKLLAAFYADPARRKSILTEYQLISDAARNFEGEAYDLSDAESRRRFKVRLLTFIRPETRDLLIEIAHAYKEKFARPLPVSSLVRPVEYQRELRETNANAAGGATPPHSTGFAFDLYYRYMTAAEQEYLMSVIARLEDEGRVEALREARDNIHVYVFSTGRHPDEKLIESVIASQRLSRSGKKLRTHKKRQPQPARRRVAIRKRR